MVPKNWYKVVVVTVPLNEEVDVDWLSPIIYHGELHTLRDEKRQSDIHRDVGTEEWNLGEEWELWKCRVEFD
jgi:hypothetical protein